MLAFKYYIDHYIQVFCFLKHKRFGAILKWIGLQRSICVFYFPQLFQILIKATEMYDLFINLSIK
jgi:hypothetical protein